MCYMLQLVGILRDQGSSRVLIPACLLGLCSSVALTTFQIFTNLIASKPTHIYSLKSSLRKNLGRLCCKKAN